MEARAAKHASRRRGAKATLDRIEQERRKRAERSPKEMEPRNSRAPGATGTLLTPE